MTMRTNPEIDNLSIDDLYNNLRVFEQEIQGAPKTSSSAQNVAFVSQSKKEEIFSLSTSKKLGSKRRIRLGKLLTMDDGIVNWGEHTEAEETKQALMASAQAMRVLKNLKLVCQMKILLSMSYLPSNDNEGSLKTPLEHTLRLNQKVPKLNSVRPNINTGRTNINSVRPKVNTRTFHLKKHGKQRLYLIVDLRAHDSTRRQLEEFEDSMVDLLPLR
ncbi:hypothetical protein Tco_0194311 [Tanacetum coccineum]